MAKDDLNHFLSVVYETIKSEALELSDWSGCVTAG